MAYVNVPLETDTNALCQEAWDFIEARFPDFVPNDGNLDTIIVEAMMQAISELRDLETDVRDQIYRYLGASLHGVVPIEATEATVDSTWTMVDTQGYTIPAGTVLAIPATGSEFAAFVVVSEVVVLAGDTVTDVGEVGLIAVEAGESGSGLSGTPQLIDATVGRYVDSVALVGLTTGGVDAESDEDYLNRLTEEFQLLTPRPIIPRDFEVLARRVAGVHRSTAIDLYNPHHNFLTLNQASLETDTTGWAANANCTVTRSTSQAADGAASLRLDATAAGDMSAITPTGASGEPVVPGEQYTALASFRTAVTVQSVRVSIRWYTSGAATISTTDGSSVADTAVGFTQATLTAIAPPTAAFAAVIVSVLSADATNELHYVDKIAFRRGNSTSWAAGDTAETNVERMVTVAVVDENGNAVSAGIKSAVDDLLQALREMNFEVHVVDPTFTEVAVTFTAVAHRDFDPASVETEAETAVEAYLEAATWGTPTGGDAQSSERGWINRTTVRYLEVAEVINRVTGIDYIETLTIGREGEALAASNLLLGGIAPLPTPGTISGAVSIAVE